MYGNSNKPAVLDILWNFRIVSTIKTQRKTISIKPSKGDLNPKKRNDQTTFSISCKPNKDKEFLTCLFFNPLFQTKYKEIPIRVKSINQTGAKSQLGGVKLGFCNVVYHVWIEEEVKIEPTIPADWHIRIENTSFDKFLSFMLIIYGFN